MLLWTRSGKRGFYRIKAPVVSRVTLDGGKDEFHRDVIFSAVVPPAFSRRNYSRKYEMRKDQIQTRLHRPRTIVVAGVPPA